MRSVILKTEKLKPQRDATQRSEDGAAINADTLHQELNNQIVALEISSISIEKNVHPVDQSLYPRISAFIRGLKPIGYSHFAF